MNQNKCSHCRASKGTYTNWHAVLFVVVLVASNVAVKVLILQ